MDELLYASATTIAQAIREKRVSATEVVEAHLQRIATVNPTLNAVVQVVGRAPGWRPWRPIKVSPEASYVGHCMGCR